MTVIDPADVTLRIGHPMGTLLVLKAPRACPCCHMEMVVWIDTGTSAACFCCITRQALTDPRLPRRVERRTPETT